MEPKIRWIVIRKVFPDGPDKPWIAITDEGLYLSEEDARGWGIYRYGQSQFGDLFIGVAKAEISPDLPLLSTAQQSEKQ